MYFWYGAEYAGGGASYSLHIKAGLVRLRDGSRKGDFPPRQLKPWFFPSALYKYAAAVIGWGWLPRSRQPAGGAPPKFRPT